MITREELSSSLREYLAGFLTEDQVNAAIKLFAGDKAKLTTMDKSSLVNAINENSNKITNINNNKLDKNGIVTMANMGQDVKEAMTGGSVSVVGENSVLEINIVNEQVTNKK